MYISIYDVLVHCVYYANKLHTVAFIISIPVILAMVIILSLDLKRVLQLHKVLLMAGHKGARYSF